MAAGFAAVIAGALRDDMRLLLGAYAVTIVSVYYITLSLIWS